MGGPAGAEGGEGKDIGLPGGSGLTMPTPGLPPHFCFHPDTAALQGLGAPCPFLEHSLKTRREPASPSGARMLTGQGQPVQFHPTPAASRRVGQFPQTAAALASPPEAGQSPQGHGGGRWGQRRWRGFPPARLLTAGASQGATAQKSKSQQVVAIPARNAKLTNVTGKNEKKKKKNGGTGKTNQNRTP